MTALLVAGSTPPELRLVGWTPTIRVPQIDSVTLPALPRSASDAGNVVFDYLKKARSAQIDPWDLIPVSEKRGASATFPNITRSDGRWYLAEGFDNVWQLATIYLLAYYATNGAAEPLPEDELGELGTAPNWPSQGDNLEQRVFGWGLKTNGWDGDIPHYELRKTLQVQKWSNSENKWKIYNQWGHDLTYGYDPVDHSWSSGFDLGEWMNEHGAEIYTAFNIVFTAISAFTGYGAVISGLQQASKGLAIAAAKGDWTQMIGALGRASAAMAQLPGVADFGRALEGAAVDTVSDTVKDVLSNPVVQGAVTVVLDAKGDVEQVIAKAEELRKTVTDTIAQIKARALDIRKNLIPAPLQPWFDKAFAKGQSRDAPNMFGPGHPVPYYAKGTWDVAVALGAMATDPNALAPMAGAATFKAWSTANARAKATSAQTPSALGSILMTAGLFGLGGVGFVKFAPAKWKRKLHVPAASNKQLLIGAGILGTMTLIGLVVRGKSTPELEAARAAIKKANDSWASYLAVQSGPQGGTQAETDAKNQAQTDYDAAYVAMVAAVRANELGSGPLAKTAKDAVTTADALWHTWMVDQTAEASAAVATNKPQTFNAMLAAIQALG